MTGRPIIFKSIFGNSWKHLPPVMHKHYANRAYTMDKVTMQGVMKVELSLLAKLFAPLMRLTGVLAPYESDNIPTTVHFDSSPADNSLRFNRIFYFPGRQPYHFRSCIIPAGGNEVIELMQYRICWHATYAFDGKKIIITHRGYKLRLFGKLIRLPLEIIVGKGYAEEEVIDDSTFRMYMEIRHLIFGRFYAYSGKFRISEVNLSE
jgi:hypothetical protein